MLFDRMIGVYEILLPRTINDGQEVPAGLTNQTL